MSGGPWPIDLVRQVQIAEASVSGLGKAVREARHPAMVRRAAQVAASDQVVIVIATSTCRDCETFRVPYTSCRWARSRSRRGTPASWEALDEPRGAKRRLLAAIVMLALVAVSTGCTTATPTGTRARGDRGARGDGTPIPIGTVVRSPSPTGPPSRPSPCRRPQLARGPAHPR